MEVEVLREVDAQQRAGVQDLLDAAREADGHTPLGEHKWLDLVHGGRRDFAGVVVCEHGRSNPVGYAHLSRHHTEPAQWGLEIVVHPARRDDGIERKLVAVALDVVAGSGGGHVHLWVFQPAPVHDRLASELGLTKGRDLLHMRVQLPVQDTPRLPEGVVLRSFDAERDADDWLRVNNRAFSHHPEQGAWDRDTLDRRMDESWFEPEGFLLADASGSLAGFCWVKPERNVDHGEIYVVGVDPDHQGSGLGKSLVLAGLRWMAEQGFSVGKLYVDAANEAAVNLYRDIGFEVHHLDRAYVTDVERR